MGIKGLNKLIYQYAPESLSEISIESLKGSKIAIDSEILLYKFKAITEDDENSHINGLLNNIFYFLKNGILPVYIFDGAPNIAKINNVLSKRSFQKEKIYSKIEELEETFIKELEILEKNDEPLSISANQTFDQLLKLRKKISSMTITKNNKNECKYLLKLLGVPYINASEDAECFCVNLQHLNMVEYVYTEDSDALTYAAALLDDTPKNGPIILKKGPNNNFIGIDLSIVLKKMNLSPKSFIDLCILCGCDFCNTIPKIGPIKAYGLIKKYLTIEKIVKELLIENFDYKIAREIFEKNNNIEKIDIKLTEINTEELKNYLYKERLINPMPIISNFLNVVEIYNSKN